MFGFFSLLLIVLSLWTFFLFKQLRPPGPLPQEKDVASQKEKRISMPIFSLTLVSSLKHLIELRGLQAQTKFGETYWDGGKVFHLPCWLCTFHSSIPSITVSIFSRIDSPKLNSRKQQYPQKWLLVEFHQRGLSKASESAPEWPRSWMVSLKPSIAQKQQKRHLQGSCEWEWGLLL